MSAGMETPRHERPERGQGRDDTTREDTAFRRDEVTQREPAAPRDRPGKTGDAKGGDAEAPDRDRRRHGRGSADVVWPAEPSRH